MKYRVNVSIVATPYIEVDGKPTDQTSSYTQLMYHNEFADVTGENYADAGAQCDAIIVGIRKVLHGDSD